ncbi:MAG: iron-sulfur cluster assembly protein, partial [Candidatus Competibacteraceae bacterium]|nr:iron-sulfur cluster assembly protein [Candidatus Competibacteraceae bacterium]
MHYVFRKSGLTESDVKKALSTVMDPDLNIDVVSLGFISEIQIEGGKVASNVILDHTG